MKNTSFGRAALASGLSVVLAAGTLFAATAPANALTAKPVYLTFESNDANATAAAAGAFEGASASIADVPTDGGHSGKGLKFTKTGQPWSGVNVLLNKSYRITDSNNKVITFDYYNPDAVASPVMAKVDGAGNAVKAVMANPGWNSLSFDMSTGSGWNSASEYPTLAIFPNFGADNGLSTTVANTGQNYYIDNLSINGATIANVEKAAKKVFLSFEDDDSNAAAAAAGAFEGASASIAAVPTDGGHSGKGLKFTKSGQPWSGVNVLLNKSYRITDANNKVITFDYFSPDNVASPVMVKVDGAGNAVKAVMANPGWNSLSFDLSTGSGWNSASEYPTLAIFPNFGADNGLSTTVANTGQNYYIDNLSINGATISDVESSGPAPRTAESLLLTFEDNDAVGALATGTNDVDGVGSFEGAPGNEIVAAPAGGNGGKVLQFTKSGQPWSGFVVVDASAGTNKFAATASPVVTTNFYNSSASAVPVMIKFEGANINARKYAVASPGWSTLTFDMSSGASGWDGTKEYTKVIFFPNFADGDLGAPAGVANEGQKYYFDDIAFNGATTPAIVPPRTAASLLLTFEDSDTVGAKAVGEASDADGAGSFEGAPANEIVDAPAGGNGGKVLQFTKSGQPWSGFIAVSDLAGTNKFGSTQFPVITANFYNSSATSVPVMIKLEAGAANARKYAVAAPGWSTLTFDMSTGANGWDGTKEYNKVVFFPNFADGDLGAPAAVANEGQKYYFDDIAMNGATTPAIPPAPVVKVSQTIGKTIALMKPVKLAALPGKTSKGLTIKWVSRTKLICVISGTSAAPKVKTLKVGTCKLTGTNAGNSTTKSVTTYRAVVVKK